MATSTRTYKVFTADSRLAAVTDALRQAEEAYYRTSIGAPTGNVPYPAGAPAPDESLKSQLDTLWERVEELQKEYDAVSKEVESNG